MYVGEDAKKFSLLFDMAIGDFLLVDSDCGNCKAKETYEKNRRDSFQVDDGQGGSFKKGGYDFEVHNYQDRVCIDQEATQCINAQRVLSITENNSEETFNADGIIGFSPSTSGILK